jgi:hypothetical protein
MKKYMYIVVLLLAVMSVQAQELLNYPLDTVNGEEVYRYQVEKSIGLYRIGVNFNVSQAEIVRCNPQLRERGLHYGETLTKEQLFDRLDAITPDDLLATAQAVFSPDRLLTLEYV